jgi:flavin-dependent dehydrogenase
MMDRCDVLIVGGGPAGSSCAWQLRRDGLDVLVMDKCAFPRDKPCAGWITPEVVDLLQLDQSEYRRGRVLQAITGFRVGLLPARGLENNYHRTVSFGIRRCEFDHYLLKRSGARCRLGEPLRSIIKHGDHWVINGEIETPMVVGAGGHFCPVARFLGANSGGAEQVVAAQEIEFELSEAQMRECRVRPEVPELYFCEDLNGYGWCFRKGNHLNVGLGREDRVHLSDHVQRFADQLKSDGHIPRDMPDQFRGHAYILYGHTRRKMIEDAVLLAGDSVGLAFTHSGEGIRTAIESGLLAAETIIAAKGDYRAARLQSYASALTSRFGQPESSDGWLTHIPMRLKQSLARRLFATHWFTRKVVLDRWFLQKVTRNAMDIAGSRAAV